MKNRRTVAALVAVAFALIPLRVCAQSESVAQPQEEPDIVDLPAVGPVDLNQIAPEWRANIRIPGKTYDEPPERFGDLPPAPFPPRDELSPPAAAGPGGDQAGAVAGPETDGVKDQAVALPPPADRKSTREEMLKRMREERAYPSGEIPEDAYRNAWEYIQLMRQAPPVVTPTPAAEPQSSLGTIGGWLARAAKALSPRAAFAQVPWTQIGPAPLIAGSILNAGVVDGIGLNPSSPTTTVYLGTFDGGVWKTTNAGPSGTVWTPITDGQPTLQLESIAIHPNNSQVILAGSGLNYNGLPDPDAPEKSIGILRSVDGGTVWCRIGPFCSDAMHCPSSNPDYTKSNLAVGQITIESASPYRVWAATSRGLWWSESAADPSKCTITCSNPNDPSTCTCDCSQVTWTLSTIPATKSDHTPDTVNRFFISPTNGQVLYAPVIASDSGNNGWWKSTNRNGSWTRVLPRDNSSSFTRAAIGSSGSTDIIWSIAAGPDICSSNGGNRIYRTTDSGATWSLMSTSLDCGLIRSVAIDPTNPASVAVGKEDLWRTTHGMDVSPIFDAVGGGTIHADHNALAFAVHDFLFDGNDGGVWYTSNFSAAIPPGPSFYNLNTNLANIEFYRGTIDTLNYGVSIGGTQDNGQLKGGVPLQWWQALRGDFGDGSGAIVNPRNSNNMYLSGFSYNRVVKTADGAATSTVIMTGLPSSIADTTLAADYSDCNTTECRTLVIYSEGHTDPPPTPPSPTPVPTPGGVFRTTNGGTSWGRISPPPPTIPGMKSFAVPPSSAPPSNLIFASACGGVWRTTDASSWSQFGSGLPNVCYSSLAIDTSQACNASSCSLYAVASGFDEACVGGTCPSTGRQCTNNICPSHVFKITDGQHWSNVSGIVEACSNGSCPSSGRPCVNNTCPYYFPNVPVNKVVIDPGNASVLYVGTDMGVFRGEYNGTTWVWTVFSSGLPQAAVVHDLAVHVNSGLLRAFTSGRSAWEAQAFAIPNPDRKVNTVVPVSDAKGPQVSALRTGKQYGVAWQDDRESGNRWHIYYQGYLYDANGNPSPLMSSEQRVDDTTDHVAQAPGIAADPGGNTCWWVTWHDDRLDRTNHYNHIFAQLMCATWKHFVGDQRVDGQATSLNATYPAIGFDPVSGLAIVTIAWHAQRSGQVSKHDIYARVLSGLGYATAPFQVSLTSQTSDATLPAVAYDGSENAYVAWQEFEPGPPQAYKILLSKYDSNFVPKNQAVRIDDGTTPNTNVRSSVALAVDNQTGTNGPTIIVTWSELPTSGPEVVYRRRVQLTSSGATFLEGQTTVASPPAFPAGANVTAFPAVATDKSSNFLIAWLGDVNTANSLYNSDFAKSFNANAALLKNDFRVDLSGRAATTSTGSAHVTTPRQVCLGGANQNLFCTTDTDCPGSTCVSSGRFPFAWRDNRVGSHYDVYTRVVPSLQ